MLDNILVASRSLSEHARHLRIVLSRLQQHGLVLNAEKCEWAQVSLSYLGHEVSAIGVKPLTYRVAAIQLFLLPPTVQLLQTYLGMVNFYLRFLRGANQILKPLTDCLKGGGQGSAGLDRRHVDSSFSLAPGRQTFLRFNRSQATHFRASQDVRPLDSKTAAASLLYLRVHH